MHIEYQLLEFFLTVMVMIFALFCLLHFNKIIVAIDCLLIIFFDSVQYAYDRCIILLKGGKRHDKIKRDVDRDNSGKAR